MPGNTKIILVFGALEGGALGGGGGGGALGALRAAGSPPAPSLGASRHSLIGEYVYSGSKSSKGVKSRRP
ncbi:unnamed protein product [Arctia plantaginis]|uniref:Uncharacterized protein n=1 Tax=Arctia plantaginis TaxID=874455 RepID=A0A8S1ATC8_ARCPL|nr:unnamed protein product [Arctia plantaginis]